MSTCENCERPLLGLYYVYTGGGVFCSPMCRDTSEQLRKYEQAKPFTSQHAVLATCGVDGCHVCSGAMRERAGRGDKNG